MEQGADDCDIVSTARGGDARFHYRVACDGPGQMGFVASVRRQRRALIAKRTEDADSPVSRWNRKVNPTARECLS